eukprot:CAMPEP_0181256574 /NCGR_PEP_ID=MMETSP1096-20121128/49787_1 /TAXON_ID=156174 ORGANISM="Chrysochromulina ericina, Strain CCMP281" /NCGR_SAMPLE_ID=MMETSP1096 /ASSEMBLY_ACC=CAM_ASM_000453 /LENGTH=66 /DNA_ID=CAMNT_0023354841 /DNA_START=319 /DNA_END=519 /DNA_ORIENTATION=-
MASSCALRLIFASVKARNSSSGLMLPERSRSSLRKASVSEVDSAARSTRATGAPTGAALASEYPGG